MTSRPAVLPSLGVDQCAGAFVVVNAGPGAGLTLIRLRRGVALLARLRHRSLDNRLARGESPENARLLAVRAAQLVSPPARRHLARRWEVLAARARVPQPPFAAFARTRTELADEIDRLAHALRADRPVSARGVALAGTLFAVAATATHRLALGGDDVVGAVARSVLAALEPGDTPSGRDAVTRVPPSG